jgi:hypothetical protein
MESILKQIKNQSNITGLKFKIYKKLEPEIIKLYPEEIDWITYFSCCRTIIPETVQLGYNKIGEVVFFYLSANKNLSDDLKLAYKNYLCDLEY